MAKIAPQGKFKGIAAGDKLYTFEAGTTTPATTYTDSTLGTANTNPVVMDVNAQADVWLDVGGYKFVLKDQNDVTYWTTDNIDGGQADGFGSTIVAISSNLALSNLYADNVIICNASLTINLQEAGTAGNGFLVVVKNNSSGDVTIDPFSTEQIDGGATLVIPAGNSAFLHCDGTEWYATGYLDISAGGDNVFTGNNTFQGTVDVTDVLAETSAGGDLQTNGGTSCLAWGAGGSANLTAGGNLSMNTTHKIVNMADPTSAQDAATKAYADSNPSGAMELHCRGSWDGTGANGSKTVSGGRGNTTFTVEKTSTGAYTVTMSDAHPEGVNYTPNLQGYRDVSGYNVGTAAQVRVNSATEFDVRTEGTGGLADFEFVSVEVYA